jgi:SAM-dependent methyltransferase
LNRAWLSRRLADRRWKAALKTDAYDEAVGEGAHAQLRDAAAWTCWMDASESMCRLAAGRYRGLAAVACDARKLPFAAGAFDLVVSISTLDHFASVAELEGALGCLYRVMQPAGCLLLTLDNLDSPLVRLRNSLPWRLLNRFRLVPYPVGATVGAAELRRLLGRAGFEVQEMTTLMHVPRAPAVALAAALDARLARLFCRTCLSFEVLGRLPTARWTANYIAVAAIKPPAKKIGDTPG